MRLLPSLIVAVVSWAPALALTSNATITSPDSSTVYSPFHLHATATSCDGVAVVSMGYSLDHNTNALVVTGQLLDAAVTASSGSHILHVKSWGRGTACLTDVSINVVQGAATLPGGIQVSTPKPASIMVTPFHILATDAQCGGVSVVSMGYSLDRLGTAYTVRGTTLDVLADASPGQHILHVKSWGAGGAACVTDLSLNVVNDPAMQVPADALVYTGIAQLSNWKGMHDAATPGSSTGTMQLVTYPSLSYEARQFAVSFTDSGGHRFSSVFGSNTSAHNFLYDGWVYLESPTSGLANLELDLNQVLANGDNMVYSYQCSGNSGTWEYGTNAGTPTSGHPHWVSSGIPCDPRQWAPDTWHHIQILSSRDDNGYHTFHSLWFDGEEHDMNVTALGEYSLRWASVLQTQFQMDGTGASGYITAYLDNLTVYAW